MTRDELIASDLRKVLDSVKGVDGAWNATDAATCLNWCIDVLSRGRPHVDATELDVLRDRIRIAEAVRDDARRHSDRLLHERRELHASLSVHLELLKEVLELADKSGRTLAEAERLAWIRSTVFP